MIERHTTRDTSIDVFKAFLVIGMILCHVLQFFGDTSRYPASAFFIEFANTMTFSGFVFAFGYTVRLAYLSKELRAVYPRILLTGTRVLVAFFISGTFFRVLVDRRRPSLELISRIVILSDIPGWSEFLVSFALYIFLVAILFRPLNKLLARPLLFWIVSAALLLSTLVPYERITINQIGLLIGTTRFASFPVLQYAPFFLVGMYVQKNKVGFDARYFVGSLFLSGIAVAHIVTNDMNLPGRFPPTVYWLLLPTAGVYCYYLLARLVGAVEWARRVFCPIGGHTLTYLLVSNVLIFAVSGARTGFQVSTFAGFVVSVVLVAMIRYIVSLNTRQAGTRDRSSPTPMICP